MKRTALRSKELLRSCQKKEREVQKEYRLNRRQIARIYRTEFALLEGYIDFSLELGRLLDSFIPGKEKPFCSSRSCGYRSIPSKLLEKQKYS